MHWCFWAGELAQALAAAATRRAQVLPVTSHDNFGDLPVTVGNHHADRRRLGTLAFRIGGVLYIAARIKFAVFVESFLFEKKSVSCRPS